MSSQEQPDVQKLIRLGVVGGAEEWTRLQGKLFAALEGVVQKVQEWGDRTPGEGEDDPYAEAVRDIAALAANWARAKVEKPSLENAKLRAEIVSEFAEAKRRLAETEKLRSETRQAEMTLALDNLERLLKFAEIVGRLQIARVGPDVHLVVGPDPKALGQPSGDATVTEEPLR